MAAAHSIPTTDPTVLAWEFTGKIGSKELEVVADAVDDAFDRYDSVSLLLIFRDWDGVDLAAAFDPAVIRTQLRSLERVHRYAVVGAPAAARSMIELSDAVIPVHAETFDRDEEEAAWAFVGARPAAP